MICMGACGMSMKVVMHGHAWPCKGEKNELEGHLKENW